MLPVTALTVHPPTVLLLASTVMAVIAALLSSFALGHRVYRGFWWWVSAMWLGAISGFLHLLRLHWPDVVVPANLMLMAWPILLVAGLRRFQNRGRLPTSASFDWVLLALFCFVWLASYGSTTTPLARALAYGVSLAVLHSYAVWFITRLPERRSSPVLRVMRVVMVLQALVPLAAVAHFLAKAAALPAPGALPPPGLVIATLIPMLVIAYLCLLLTHERTESDLRETQRQLRVLADTDMLTQVPNRRHFEELAGAALSGPKPRRAVLVLFDIDHFKRINDGYGHAVGDEALRTVASCTRQTLRTRDVLGRIGGDEFMLLLPGASVDDALLVADRITCKLDAQTRILGQWGVPLSLSFGLVDIEPGEKLESAQHRADMALYEAKRQGRKRAVPARREGLETVFGDSRSLGLTSEGMN